MILVVLVVCVFVFFCCFFFQAEDGIRDLVRSRGLGDVYKRQAQALAALRGRDFVIPDDIKYLAPAVLTHRISIHPQTRLRGRTPEQVITEIVASVPVPVEK